MEGEPKLVGSTAEKSEFAHGLRLHEKSLTGTLEISKWPISQTTLEIANGANMEEKAEYHVTILGSKMSKVIRDVARERKVDKSQLFSQIAKIITKYDWRCTPLEEYYMLEKEYSEPEKEKRKSIIQIVTLESFTPCMQEIKEELGVELPTAFPHVTIFAFSTTPKNMQVGIGIHSEEEFRAMRPQKIRVGDE